MVLVAQQTPRAIEKVNEIDRSLTPCADDHPFP
jgi:hypothetical protein